MIETLIIQVPSVKSLRLLYKLAYDEPKYVHMVSSLVTRLAFKKSSTEELDHRFFINVERRRDAYRSLPGLVCENCLSGLAGLDVMQLKQQEFFHFKFYIKFKSKIPPSRLLRLVTAVSPNGKTYRVVLLKFSKKRGKKNQLK